MNIVSILGTILEKPSVHVMAVGIAGVVGLVNHGSSDGIAFGIVIVTIAGVILTAITGVHQ